MQQIYKQEKFLLGGASGLGLSVTGTACYSDGSLNRSPDLAQRSLSWDGLNSSSCGDSVRGALGRPLTNGELLLFIIFGDAGMNPGPRT